MNLEDIKKAKEMAFPHKLVIHSSFRQLAGWYLSKQGIRIGKDYRRHKEESKFTDSRILRFERTDTYIFRNKNHAALLKLWLPAKPPEQKIHFLPNSGGAFFYTPYIPLIVTNVVKNEFHFQSNLEIKVMKSR